MNDRRGMPCERKTNGIILVLLLYVVIGKTFIPAENLFIYRNEYVGYVVGVLVCLLLSRTFFKSKPFFAFLAYVIVLFLNYFLETFVNLGNILSEAFTIIMTACLGYYLFHECEDKRMSNWLIMLFTIVIVVYSVATFIFYLTSPGIMRSAAMGYNYEMYRPLFLRGLAPYTFPHALACVIPTFVLGLKVSKTAIWKKWICACLLLLSLVLIYITQATGALMVAVFASFLSFIARPGNVKKNVATIVVVSLILSPLFVSSTIQIALLEKIGNAIGEESHYSSKIEEMETSLSGVESEGDFSTRGELLEKTFNAIIHHPILGVSDRSYGNHNALLDRWAEYGLIGFLPLMLGIVMMIKITTRRLPKDILIFYYIGVASNFIMMLTKSMFGWHQWFAFLIVLPLMIRFFGVETNQLSKQNNVSN